MALIEHDPVLRANLRRRARDTYISSERIEVGSTAELSAALRALTTLAETLGNNQADLKSRVDQIESILVEIGNLKAA